MLQAVSESKVDFPDDDWAGVSEEAKEFVSGLIEPDVERRYTIEKALKHPWIATHVRHSRADFSRKAKGAGDKA